MQYALYRMKYTEHHLCRRTACVSCHINIASPLHGIPMYKQCKADVYLLHTGLVYVYKPPELIEQGVNPVMIQTMLR